MKILIIFLILLLSFSCAVITDVAAQEKFDVTDPLRIDKNPIHQTCELPNKCDGIGGKFYSVKLSDGITMTDKITVEKTEQISYDELVILVSELEKRIKVIEHLLEIS